MYLIRILKIKFLGAKSPYRMKRSSMRTRNIKHANLQPTGPSLARILEQWAAFLRMEAGSAIVYPKEEEEGRKEGQRGAQWSLEYEVIAQSSGGVDPVSIRVWRDPSPQTGSLSNRRSIFPSIRTYLALLTTRAYVPE